MSDVTFGYLASARGTMNALFQVRCSTDILTAPKFPNITFIFEINRVFHAQHRKKPLPYHISDTVVCGIRKK